MILAVDTTAATAWKNLALIQSDSMHQFVNDGYSYAQVATRKLQGHKQVTDYGWQPWMRGWSSLIPMSDT